MGTVEKPLLTGFNKKKLAMHPYHGGSSYDKFGLDQWPWTAEAIYNTFIKLAIPISGSIFKEK